MRIKAKKVIRYKFYEKPISNVKVAEAESTHPSNQKYATLYQQVMTRMLNCDMMTPMKTRVAILNDFVKKLRTSGYSRGMIARVIRNGVVSFNLFGMILCISVLPGRL